MDLLLKRAVELDAEMADDVAKKAMEEIAGDPKQQAEVSILSPEIQAPDMLSPEIPDEDEEVSVEETSATVSPDGTLSYIDSSTGESAVVGNVANLIDEFDERGLDNDMLEGRGVSERLETIATMLLESEAMREQLELAGGYIGEAERADAKREMDEYGALSYVDEATGASTLAGNAVDLEEEFDDRGLDDELLSGLPAAEKLEKIAEMLESEEKLIASEDLEDDDQQETDEDGALSYVDEATGATTLVGNAMDLEEEFHDRGLDYSLLSGLPAVEQLEKMAEMLLESEEEKPDAQRDMEKVADMLIEINAETSARINDAAPPLDTPRDMEGPRNAARGDDSSPYQQRVQNANARGDDNAKAACDGRRRGANHAAAR